MVKSFILKYLQTILLAVGLVFSMPNASFATPVETDTESYKQGELLVQFSAEVSFSKIDELLEAEQAQVIEVLRLSDSTIYRLQVPITMTQRTQEALVRWRGFQEVKIAALNSVYSVLDAKTQSAINALVAAGIDIGALTSARSLNGLPSFLTPASDDIVIAVVDLFVRFDEDPAHGEYVVDSIEQVTSGMKILEFNIKSDNGISFELSEAVKALDKAIQSGANVINMSWGGGGFNEILSDKIQTALDAGIILIAAAGNNDGGDVIYPAAYEGVISVGALDDTISSYDPDNSGSIADYSAVGADIYAPGTLVSRGNTVQGTSFASPAVAGVVANILRENDELRAILQFPFWRAGGLANLSNHPYDVIQQAILSILTNSGKTSPDSLLIVDPTDAITEAGDYELASIPSAKPKARKAKASPLPSTSDDILTVQPIFKKKFQPRPITDKPKEHVKKKVAKQVEKMPVVIGAQPKPTTEKPKRQLRKNVEKMPVMLETQPVSSRTKKIVKQKQAISQPSKKSKAIPTMTMQELYRTLSFGRGLVNYQIH